MSDETFILVVEAYNSFAVVRVDEYGNRATIWHGYHLEDCLNGAASYIGKKLSIPLVVES